MKNWFFLSLLVFLLLHSCNRAEDHQGGNTVPQAEAEASNTLDQRPHYHFSPSAGYLEAPTGLLFHNEEYHIFYQYSPKVDGSDLKYWGHAVSKNLTHWEHLPIALAPDDLGEIHAGSVVMDYNNTSGLAEGDQAAMIAYFTYHHKSATSSGSKDRQSQGMAYSTDEGRTWTKYAQNPVFSEEGLKDPKIIWYAPEKKWVMLLAASDQVKLFTSKDLKTWTFASAFGADQGSHAGKGEWGSPDLFYMPYEGVANKGGTWVLLASIEKGAANRGSATQYFLGEFDGKTFTNSNPKEMVMWLDFGMDYTAAQSWSGAKIGDSRRIVSAWMSNSMYATQTPTKNWRGMLSLPRTLRLIKESNISRLDIQVSKEIRSLNYGAKTLSPINLSGEKDITSEFSFTPKSSILLVDFVPNDGKRPVVGIEYSNAKGEKVVVDYDFSNGTYAIDRGASGQVNFAADFSGKNSIRTGNGQAKSSRIFIFKDLNSVEVFAERNSLALSSLFFPSQPYDRIKVFSKGGATNVQIRAMGERGVWK